MATTPIPYGRFLLVDRVAVGGMAEVWAAVARGDAAVRLYAIKRLLPTVAEHPELVRMFLDEGRLAAQLAHPGFVRVHELGWVGCGPYIAMDYVAGRDLRTLLGRMRRRGERLPVELAAHVVARAADALDHAHRGRAADGAELRLVHQDVSPANVLLGFDGAVRVLDFGIAQVATGRPVATAALRGRLGYTSPEILRGLPVDRRSDVFALGAVLHELLTGERLFAGPTELAVAEKVQAAEAHPPSGANPRVPRALDEVVLRALARDPERRFAWASELRDALSPWAGRDRPGGGEAALAGFLARALPEELRAEEDLRARATLGAG